MCAERCDGFQPDSPTCVECAMFADCLDADTDWTAFTFDTAPVDYAPIKVLSGYQVSRHLPRERWA